ncbi:TetR/AcrR family transcriptional regulator, partial [Streptomyces sp. NPDC059538]|uniref:TetR/AcrR family transcriptional regulator n=1 Tax=Streptomyces sp. NPDC059538 TaxID=3346860 RepID=UPI0036C9EC60
MPSGARRYDPDRRQRIIDAAIRVVGDRGIAGLSHRSVAAEADVPLGSTTYHFKTLDDLLVAALHQANEGFAQAVAGSAALADPDADLAAALARLLGKLLAADRGRVELEYELYLAALGGAAGVCLCVGRAAGPPPPPTRTAWRPRRPARISVF